jgi:hypothetical protein
MKNVGDRQGSVTLPSNRPTPLTALEREPL